MYVSSVLYLITKKRFRPRVPKDAKLNCRNFTSTISGDTGASWPHPGQELGMARTGWAWWATADRQCKPWHGLTGDHTWNHRRGVAGCPHGQRDTAVTTLRAGDKGSTVTRMSDTAYHPSWHHQALEPSHCPKLAAGTSWSEHHWPLGETRGAGLCLGGGSERVKSCCCFWQSLSLAWPAKLDWALQHRIAWCSFSSPWH